MKEKSSAYKNFCRIYVLQNNIEICKSELNALLSCLQEDSTKILPNKNCLTPGNLGVTYSMKVYIDGKDVGEIPLFKKDIEVIIEHRKTEIKDYEEELESLKNNTK